MEKENQIKDDFDKGKQEGSAKENEASYDMVDKIQKKKITPKKFLKITIIFIIFLFAWFAVVQYITADKYEAVVMVMEEGGQIGVNPMTERLDFGDLPKGNGSSRFVTIENNGNISVYIKVVKFGDISEIMMLDKNGFILESGKNEKLTFNVKVPISANEGQYKGKVLIFRLPKLF